jgi:hypothetical protein
MKMQLRVPEIYFLAQISVLHLFVHNTHLSVKTYYITYKYMIRQ